MGMISLQQAPGRKGKRKVNRQAARGALGGAGACPVQPGGQQPCCPWPANQQGKQQRAPWRRQATPRSSAGVSGSPWRPLPMLPTLLMLCRT